MELFFENMQMAINSVKSNKMRSFLTMLGIIIGIASVITITSLGDSISRSMNKYFENFGKNRLLIYINYEKIKDSGYDDNDLFSEDDANMLKSKLKEKIEYASGYYGTDTQEFKINDKTSKNYISGVDYKYFDLTPIKIIYGRTIGENDIKKNKTVIMLSKDAAKQLFGRENAAGETVNAAIYGQNQTFKIIGVYDKEATIFDSINRGDSHEAFVPCTLFTSKPCSMLDIFVNENYDAEKVKSEIINIISRYHKKEKDFYTAESLKEQINMINSMFSTLSLGLGAIAAISLLVGGIGIMNIMLVSVTERTREIGIRKSLGARNKDILMQFLVESVVLSAAGGAVGTVIGLAASAGLASFIKTPFAMPVRSVLVAVIFSAAVGISFGLFPANKASKLNPIDALRYE